MGQLGVCAQIFRVLLVIFNILYTAFGIVLFAIGIYAVVTTQKYDFITGNTNVSGPIILIVCSIITMAIGALGCAGACCKLRPLLLIYGIVWIIIVILEIISAGLSFYYSDNIPQETAQQYRNGWERALTNYNSTDAREAVDAAQRALKCCGIDNATDWAIFNPYQVQNNMLPTSCKCTSGDKNCGNVTVSANGINFSENNIYTIGCYDRTLELSQYISYISGSIAITFAIVEILAIVVAFGLICCITAAKREKEYV